MLAKAKNGHTNIWYILLLNFVATYNIRSPTQDSEKEIVLCKKGDDITRFDGTELFEEKNNVQEKIWNIWQLWTKYCRIEL